MSTKESTQNGFLEKRFQLSKHGTNPKTEILAGITTFMTMAYILIVNPLILSDAGMDFGAVFTATALSSVIATLVMAFYANYPFALAPGMGLNAFFAYGIVLGMGYSWQMALTAVFIEGIIFILLTLFNVREAIVKAIPLNLKHAVSVGIGLFIAFIGLKNAGVVVPYESTIITLGDMTAPGSIMALVGLVITGVMLAKGVKGALLIGIFATTLLGVPLGMTEIPSRIITAPPSLSPLLFQFDFSSIFTMDMVIILFTLLFVDMFDTLGTLVGVASKADMLDESGNLPKAKQALFADAIGTTAGACMGTSTVTTYVESASGVAEGGRTGLTALSTAGMFAIALLLSPLFIMIPGAATAPALVLVGLFMMSPINKIDLDDFTESIPAFLTIIMMPLTFSIADGIVFGMVSYTALKIFTGKVKDVSAIMIVLSILFIIKFAL
ncbi:NCS2 family permease [Tindallia californiensis]|uniref:Putative MFS transporter, AGZA family, xanthine/uracil permease n=1 Tax=Tindallia californiensis TaxID=159292 RepID=A0A1H3Q953_9FIRM|nr:NCS2 family permease [Tindallia californiensis]SDZ09209.1 putative MFS transporter, AGZA family, xanthine/uracil permease [Tindallia californiensis]